MDDALHVVLAGGGTAGHLFPGLAVAEQLVNQYPGVQITFAGTGKVFEQQQVTSAGFEYRAFAAQPFPRRASEAIKFFTASIAGYRAARRFLRQTPASVVVGLGGYGSIPLVRAAARMKLPILLLEQNSTPGLATRWLAQRSALVCTAFELASAALKPSCRIRVTGNPLRTEFAAISEYDLWKRFDPPRTNRRILVLGGSGGARQLNHQVPRALYKAGAALAGWEIVHQTGQRECESTAELYQKLGLRATVLPFITNMARTLLDTDLAVSRSGATTLAELAVTGVPAILVPYPRARDDHQRKNADVLSAAGACRVVDSREVAGRLDDHLARSVVELACDSERRRQMAHAMRRSARPDASRLVAKSVIELARTGMTSLAA